MIRWACLGVLLVAGCAERGEFQFSLSIGFATGAEFTVEVDGHVLSGEPVQGRYEVWTTFDSYEDALDHGVRVRVLDGTTVVDEARYTPAFCDDDTADIPRDLLNRDWVSAVLGVGVYADGHLSEAQDADRSCTNAEGGMNSVQIG